MAKVNRHDFSGYQSHTAMWEVGCYNSDWTSNQGLKITGKIMLDVHKSQHDLNTWEGGWGELTQATPLEQRVGGDHRIMD